MRISEIKGEPDFMKSFESSDGSVTGVLAINKNSAAIHEWNSITTGMGNTTKALKELRRKYHHISAIGIGLDDNEPSWSYWFHMRSTGLIDRLEDDNGRDVTSSLARDQGLSFFDWNSND